IVGVVDRGQIIDGSKVRIGDVVLGLPSNGLHTNGYSLARKILFQRLKLKLSSRIPGVRGTLGEELLRVHKNYQPLLVKVSRGMIAIVRQRDVMRAKNILHAKVIGRIERGSGKTKLSF